MREVIEAAALEGVASLYPGVRKVTVDEVDSVAYVFTGRSLKAVNVSGEEFDALVKALPATAGDDVAQGAASPDPAAPKAKRGKSEKAAE
jgi:hypothetical protein